jgi:hypothetical protein
MCVSINRTSVFCFIRSDLSDPQRHLAFRLYFNIFNLSAALIFYLKSCLGRALPRHVTGPVRFSRRPHIIYDNPGPRTAALMGYTSTSTRVLSYSQVLAHTGTGT